MEVLNYNVLLEINGKNTKESAILMQFQMA